jgi:hypothetical protein
MTRGVKPSRRALSVEAREVDWQPGHLDAQREHAARERLARQLLVRAVLARRRDVERAKVRPADELAREPWAGCVLAISVDVPGLPVNFARLA